MCISFISDSAKGESSSSKMPTVREMLGQAAQSDPNMAAQHKEWRARQLQRKVAKWEARRLMALQRKEALLRRMGLSKEGKVEGEKSGKGEEGMETGEPRWDGKGRLGDLVETCKTLNQFLITHCVNNCKVHECRELHNKK